MRNSNTEKLNDTITVFLFLAAIFCILIACLLMPDKEKSQSENRELEQTPNISVRTVLDGSFMKEFERYTSDQVVARDVWVSMKNNMDRNMGKTDNGSVYFGKDGYLFPMEKIDETQLKLNLHYTKSFLDGVKEQNPEIKTSVIIAPTSGEILKEKLPEHAALPYQQRVMQAAEKVLGNEFKDVSDTLKIHKDEYIYYRTDHHWTSLGAYYAYRAWAVGTGRTPRELNEFDLETVSDDFYGTSYSKAVGCKTQADIIDKYSYRGKRQPTMTVETLKGQVEHESIYDAEYLKEKDKYSYFLSGNNALTTVHTQTKNGKKLLVIKDSYANCFIPFLANDFETIYVADLRFYKANPLKAAAESHADEVLVLYNAVQFAQDRNLAYLQVKE